MDDAQNRYRIDEEDINNNRPLNRPSAGRVGGKHKDHSPLSSSHVTRRGSSGDHRRCWRTSERDQISAWQARDFEVISLL
jgi:hypothetical protein